MTDQQQAEDQQRAEDRPAEDQASDQDQADAEDHSDDQDQSGDADQSGDEDQVSDEELEKKRKELEEEASDHPGGEAYVEQEVRIEKATKTGETALDGTPVDKHEQERRERLDPENRPDNTEVDNTQRDFDFEKGMFEDNPEYEEAPKKFPPLGEGGA